MFYGQLDTYVAHLRHNSISIGVRRHLRPAIQPFATSESEPDRAFKDYPDRHRHRQNAKRAFAEWQRHSARGIVHSDSGQLWL